MKTPVLNVAVLMGGPSTGYERSIKSGGAVMRGLDRIGYNAVPVLISRAGLWSRDIGEIKRKADMAFLATHGSYGEDGTLQDILRGAEIPHTGSEVLPSALAAHKALASRLIASRGVRVPRYMEFSRAMWRDAFLEEMEFPVVVKPMRHGGSVGVSVARNREELLDALRRAFSFDGEAIVQEYVRGRELSCMVLDNGDGDAFPLPPVEVGRVYGGYIDYRAKHSAPVRRVSRADISEEESARASGTAVLLHGLIGASGVSKTDMILGDDGELAVLEINTIPSFAEDDLLAYAALLHGLSFHDLLDRIIDAALFKHGMLLRAL